VLYLNGILNSRSHAQFQFIVDKTLAAVVQMTDLPSPVDLIVTFHSFAANLRLDEITEPVVAFSAKVDKPTRTKVAARKCTTCKVSFQPYRDAHLLCRNCAVLAKPPASRALAAVVDTLPVVDTPLTRAAYDAQLSPQVQHLIQKERQLAQQFASPSALLSSFPYQNILSDPSTVDASAACEVFWPPSAFMANASVYL
jgi:hypothetical protein